MRVLSMKNMANYISLERLKHVFFGTKSELPVSSILQKEIAKNCENDHVSFN